MAREGSTAQVLTEEIEETRQDDTIDRLESWIVALEADQLRLARANAEREARERQRDLRYLEFVREVLR